MAITPVSLSLPPIAPALTPGAADRNGAAVFQKVFTDAVAQVESFQDAAKTSVGRFLSGEGEELHQVALRAQQADLSFELFMQVRNKIVAAYQEVMRMQV